MPMVEIFAVAAEDYAAEEAAALAAEEVASAAAAEAAASGAGAATAAELGAMGAGAAELGAAGSGITQAGLAADVTAGGAGAGGAGINEAMVAAQQQAATAIPNSGVMAPSQQAYMNASTAGINSASSMPLPASGAGIPADPYAGLQTNTGFAEQAGAGVQPINTQPAGYGNVIDNGGMNAPQPSAWDRGYAKASQFVKDNPYTSGYLGLKAIGAFDQPQPPGRTPYNGPLTKYRMSPDFKAHIANPQGYQYTPRYAEGGILAAGPVEQMSNQNAIGANTGYPQADIGGHAYATPWQTPVSQNVLSGAQDANVDPYTGQERFAAGGIASYKKGGNLSSTLDYYTDMMDGHNSRPVAEKGDPGIYRDTDPDTMYLDPLSAAQVRMAKINKRANMQLPGMKRPTPMGQLNLRPQGVKGEASGSSLDPENAAQGGIMQAHGHLGGYAAGGNPRLLKGPGDGMSDNIPATIAGKQPARLADGEFVVPADVVSHLGNGSTDAGAKKLHQMMTKVRKARTGNSKQGKQIDPNKFTPK